MDEIATKTLAEIYLRQGDLQRAYEIYKILSQRDPSDTEIQKKLKELNRAINPSPSSPLSLPLSKEEKIRYLERWLERIEKRKKG